jgi:hypothetical protein
MQAIPLPTANLKCFDPGLRLLPDLAGSVLEATLGSLPLRQIKQQLQRVRQESLPTKDTVVYYTRWAVEKISKEKEISFASKR